MDFHPIADLFPLLAGADLDALADDIRDNGLLHPIVRHGGKILDGRNRFRACGLAGVEPRFVDFDGPDPLAFVVSANLHRRHLNESQRGMVAAKVATMTRGRQPIETNVGIPTFAPPVSQTQAAALLNVSRDTVIRATNVMKKGGPRLRKAVEDGEVKLHTASRLADLPNDQQEEALDARSAAAASERQPVPTVSSPSCAQKQCETRTVAIVRANEAINALSRIPKNDHLRERGFQIVMDWIRAAKRK